MKKKSRKQFHGWSSVRPIYQHIHRYTLIELIVTLAVIVILASTLASVMKVALVKQKEVSCANKLKDLAYVINEYTNDHNNSYFNKMNSSRNPWTLWALNDYIEPPSGWSLNTAYQCPADDHWENLHDGTDHMYKYEPSYGYNHNLNENVRVAQLEVPEDTIVFADSGHRDEDNGAAWMIDRFTPRRVTRLRHPESGANVLWADLHVKMSSHAEVSEFNRSDEYYWKPRK